MKIDKVTYEVDLSDGDKRPIYVWEAPVRVWHWLMVVTMFTMIVTGYLWMPIWEIPGRRSSSLISV